MNAKVANVIAVELGLLIVILSWLAFSSFSSLKPAAPAEELRALENSLAMIQPVSRQPNYPQNAPASSAIPQPHLTTAVPPTVQPNQALQYGALDYYDPFIASTPYTVVDDTPAPPATYYDPYSDPYYSGSYQQPTIPYPDDYYYLPNDYGYYPSPGQIIVISNVSGERSRACFDHRPRHAPGGAGQVRPPNRPGGRGSHPPGGLIAPRGGNGGAGVIGPRRGGGGKAIAPRGNGGGRSSPARGTGGGSRGTRATAVSISR